MNSKNNQVTDKMKDPALTRCVVSTADVKESLPVPSPCPICNTAEMVYVVSSKYDHTRFQCICNVCGMGENDPDSKTEKEAISFWNYKHNLQQSEKYKKYEKFKLQWMLDHGYTLSDLVEHLDMMIHEDHAEETGIRTSLPSLFEDWEFGVGFTGGAVWPCFEEWLASDRKA